MDDAAVLPLHGPAVMSTDGYTVTPLEFPGGNIGTLAVHGTVNDVSMMGARPLYLSCAFILEEGLELELLDRIAASMGEAARRAGVHIVTGDTKVVPAVPATKCSSPRRDSANLLQSLRLPARLPARETPF